MLEEFAANAPDGKLVLNVVDPLPFSEDEDRAEQFGLQGRERRPGRRSRLLRLGGLEQRRHDGSNSVLPARSAQGSVPRVRPRAARLQPREHRQDGRRLADERADRRRLRSADAAAIATVGSRRASEAAARGADAAGERAHDRATTSTCSGSCIRTMLDDGTLYAIDQFVMRGGRALIFVDPMAEILARRRTRRASGSAAPRRPRRSSRLFDRLGRQLQHDERRHRQPLRAQHRRPLPAGPSHRLDRPRRRGDEPGRPDHLGPELREPRELRATSSSPRAPRRS